MPAKVWLVLCADALTATHELTFFRSLPVDMTQQDFMESFNWILVASRFPAMLSGEKVIGRLH
jgi:hypothetical protein